MSIKRTFVMKSLPLCFHKEATRKIAFHGIARFFMCPERIKQMLIHTADNLNLDLTFGWLK